MSEISEALDRLNTYMTEVRYQTFNSWEAAIGIFWSFYHKDLMPPELTCSRYSRSGYSAEQLLKRHGVTMWARSIAIDGKSFSFHVKARQAPWAEYIIVTNGFRPQHVLHDGKVHEYAATKEDGYEPAKHRKRQPSIKKGFRFPKWLRI